jgi:tRNA(adenine34) deaminase
MRMAIDQARLAFQKGEIPVGAVAVYQGEVIGRGHNCKETERDPTAHAEMIALREAARTRRGWRLPDVTLYCTMEPCPMCAGALVQARISRLVYAVEDPKSGAAGSVMDLLHHSDLNHKVDVTRGIMVPEVEALLAAFFHDLRNGCISRYSEGWKRRRLAGNTDPV